MNQNRASRALKVELISIGREVLDGRVVDTNAVEIANLLKPLGLVPRFAQRVDDDFERVAEAFTIAKSRAEIILVTGGLGPTTDDLTLEAFSRFSGRALHSRPDALAQIEAYFKRMKRTMLPIQHKQALFPEGSEVLTNPEGTAPGCAVLDFAAGVPGRAAWFFMPGVPREMRRMLAEQVLPRLKNFAGDPDYRTATWYTHFTAESVLQETLNPVIQALPAGFELSFRTRIPENHIGLYGSASTPEREVHFDRAAAEITRLLGADVFSATDSRQGSTERTTLESVVAERLQSRDARLALAESATGGLVANRLTDLPGASAFLAASWVTYSADAKTALLGVPSALIADAGVVSESVARAMVLGALDRLAQMYPKRDALIAASITGIAGPSTFRDPQTDQDYPLGLAFVGIAFRPTASSEPQVSVHRVSARPTLARPLMKQWFAQSVLDHLRKALA